MSEMVRKDLLALGFKEAELVPTGGHPGVWGYYDAGADKTLAVYMMYDVQPVEPTGWSVNAFDGALVDRPLGKVLMARGATNQKAPERAFLNALEAIIKTQGKLPSISWWWLKARRSSGRPLPRSHRQVRSAAQDRVRRLLPVQQPGTRRRRQHVPRREGNPGVRDRGEGGPTVAR
jgi:hypothetical protein